MKQVQKVGKPGSFSNQMMGNNSTVPKAGEGCTELLFSDRICYNVIEVSEDGKACKMERLAPTHTPGTPSGEGHQNWTLTPTDLITTAVWRKNAWYFKRETITFTKKFQTQMQAEGFTVYPAYLRKMNPELLDKVYGGMIMPQNVVEGITRMKTQYTKTSLLFGSLDPYHDWTL